MGFNGHVSNSDDAVVEVSILCMEGQMFNLRNSHPEEAF